jgi:hypothetical protein
MTAAVSSKAGAGASSDSDRGMRPAATVTGKRDQAQAVGSCWMQLVLVESNINVSLMHIMWPGVTPVYLQFISSLSSCFCVGS